MKKLILSEKEIQEICFTVGNKITNDFKKLEKTPVIIGVMKGALNFTMDMLKYVDCPVLTDFIRISSMSGEKSTGKVKLINELTIDIKDRVVVIVEDIIDTGISMNYLIQHIKENFSPKEVRVCTFLNKIDCRKVDVKIDYEGYRLKGNDFLVGYGLDYYELGRNIPYVYVPDETEIHNFDKLIVK